MFHGRVYRLLKQVFNRIMCNSHNIQLDRIIGTRFISPLCNTSKSKARVIPRCVTQREISIIFNGVIYFVSGRMSRLQVLHCKHAFSCLKVALSAVKGSYYKTSLSL